MEDDEDNEGMTAEQKEALAIKHRTGGGGFPGIEQINEMESYLGDPEVIQSMLSAFLSDVANKRLTEAAVPPPGEDLEIWLHDRVQKDVQALLGRSNSYTAMSADWNNPHGGIVRAVKDRYNLTGGVPEEIVAHPFYALVQTALLCEELDERGEEWAHLLDGEITSAVATFLGQPDPNIS